MGSWPYQGLQGQTVVLCNFGGNAEGKEEVGVVEDGQSSDEDEFQDAQQIPTLKVSMHALLGSPTTAHTFTLKLKIGGSTTIALVDTGSDASFITTKLAVKANCKITIVDTVAITAANGKEILSNTACLRCSYSIQGHIPSILILDCLRSMATI